MLQEEARPIFAVVARHGIERVERQLMMGAIGVRGVDNSEREGTWEPRGEQLLPMSM